MRFLWAEWSARTPTHSRPRVARAVEAARLVREASGSQNAGQRVGLGSATVDVGALRHFEAVDRAAQSGPLQKVARRARRGLTTQLVWATARAAQEAGRQPEEVWAEALRDWLATQAPAAAAAPSRTVEARRRQGWSAIDDALHALRAS